MNATTPVKSVDGSKREKKKKEMEVESVRRRRSGASRASGNLKKRRIPSGL